MHPILAPGTHLLRRGPDQLQAGLDPATAVPLAGRELAPHQLNPLVRAGLASADDAALRQSLPPLDGDPTDPAVTWRRHAAADVGRRHGDRVADVLDERDRHEVSLHVFGHPLGRLLGDDLADLCRRLDLPVAGTGRGARPTARHGGPTRRPRTVRSLPVLLGVGEPQRTLVDPWLHDRTPHLLLRLTEGTALLGPFVEPGRTACLRCLDAHRSEEDRCWPLLVEQYAQATRRDRADGIPEPVDPALAAVAVGWAVRDLATYAEGGVPSTLGTTVRLAPGLTEIETRAWSPHAHCGCTWS